MHAIWTIPVWRWLAWALIVGGMALVVWQVVRPAADVEVLDTSALTTEVPVVDEPATPTLVAQWVVYISGAVMHPGVYMVHAQARVVDVVVLAGGLNTDADMVAINLAEPVSDGLHVHVPTLADVAPVAEANDAVSTQIAINTASAQALDALPGIGPALAARIVAYREAHGDFTTMQDLAAVPGIGPALQSKLAPLIRFTRDG